MENNKKMHDGVTYTITKEWVVGDIYFNNFGVECYLTDTKKVIMIPVKFNRTIRYHAKIVELDFYKKRFGSECEDCSITKITNALIFLGIIHEDQNENE